MKQDLNWQTSHWQEQSRDLFYLPSRSNLRRISLGHRAMLADLIWTRALLYAGSHFTNKTSIHWIPRYVDAITSLDPTFRKPYMWGSVILLYNRIGSYREHAYMSIELLKRGQQQFPDDYEFPYQLALSYLYEIKFAGRSYQQLQADHKLFCQSDYFQRKPDRAKALVELRPNYFEIRKRRGRSHAKQSARWMKLFHKTKKCMRRQAATLLSEASSKPNAPPNVAMLATVMLKRGGNSNIVVCEHLQDLLWRAESKGVRERLQKGVEQYCSREVLEVLFCREKHFTKRWQAQLPYISRKLFQLVDMPALYQRQAPLAHPLRTAQQDCQSLPKR